MTRFSRPEIAPQTPANGVSAPEQTGLDHPLAGILGQFEGEAWEEHRAMLEKLRQADAEEDAAE